MFFVGIAVIIIAIVIAELFNTFYPLQSIWIKMFEYVGYVCWTATLGTLGWEIRTWSGNTSTERLDLNLAKILSLIGVFSFVLARELVSSSN